MSGWIALSRKIRKHWIMDKPEYFTAWVIMLMEVNHEPKKILVAGELITCDRGESLLSIESWSKTFGKGWSRQKVRTFFELLEQDGMILTKGLQKTTKLTICNYKTYQNRQPTDNQQITNKQPTDNQQITTTKQLNKDNKDNKEENTRTHAREEPIIVNAITPSNKPTVEMALADASRFIAMQKLSFDNLSIVVNKWWYHQDSKNWFGVANWKSSLGKWILEEDSRNKRAKASSTYDKWENADTASKWRD